jgi:hypothetical protein
MIFADRLVAAGWTRWIVWAATIVLDPFAVLGALGRTVEVAPAPADYINVNQL